MMAIRVVMRMGLLDGIYVQYNNSTKGEILRELDNG